MFRKRTQRERHETENTLSEVSIDIKQDSEEQENEIPEAIARTPKLLKLATKRHVRGRQAHVVAAPPTSANPNRKSIMMQPVNSLRFILPRLAVRISPQVGTIGPYPGDPIYP
ncbi:MAG: hypothetical protein HOI66_10915 [Verrucomicrobia bacterium]|jgi:hypothetical protein|nr:hypothetical protein [Verrucomicrobiota bacterium]